MRLFTAVNFSGAAKDYIISAQRELKACCGGGRFTDRENLHLTLVFLGELLPEWVEEANAALNRVSAPAFELTIGGFGRFSRPGGDIWWLGVEACRELLELHERLCVQLCSRGFEFDSRPYRPHLTIARQVRNAMEPQWERDPFCEAVGSIELMKSERFNGRLTYTPLFSKKLHA